MCLYRDAARATTSQRGVLLAEGCQENQELRRRIEALLAESLNGRRDFRAHREIARGLVRYACGERHRGFTSF
jgi:hypothetical protein